MSHSNIQIYVIMVTNPAGLYWPVGTPTQRGFTEQGAKQALETIKQRLPKGWKAGIREVSSIDSILAVHP